MSDSNLSFNDLTRFRLEEINKIKEYFDTEIKERKEINRKLSKYIVLFDNADKTFITLSSSFGTLSLVSHATIVGIPVGIAGSSLTVIFSLTTGNSKNITKYYKEKKKKHNSIIVSPKSKLNSIETLMSQALIDLDISHEDSRKIIDEKEKYEQMKENIKNTKSIGEIDTLSQRDNTVFPENNKNI